MYIDHNENNLQIGGKYMHVICQVGNINGHIDWLIAQFNHIILPTGTNMYQTAARKNTYIIITKIDTHNLQKRAIRFGEKKQIPNPAEFLCSGLLLRSLLKKTKTKTQ